MKLEGQLQHRLQAQKVKSGAPPSTLPGNALTSLLEEPSSLAPEENWTRASTYTVEDKGTMA